MRVPGIHVLLTAGVVAVTSIGTVAAFSLAGSSEAEQRLPAVAPPPAVAAPLEPAPLPPAPPAPASPAPAAEQDPAAEPTRDAAPDRDRSDDGDRPTRERDPDPPKDRGDDKPAKSTVKPDPHGTDQQKLAYACQSGFLHGDICKRYT
jgi:type IV secretory pathway VirB10-like protein